MKMMIAKLLYILIISFFIGVGTATLFGNVGMLIGVVCGFINGCLIGKVWIFEEYIRQSEKT